MAESKSQHPADLEQGHPASTLAPKRPNRWYEVIPLAFLIHIVASIALFFWSPFPTYREPYAQAWRCFCYRHIHYSILRSLAQAPTEIGFWSSISMQLLLPLVDSKLAQLRGCPTLLGSLHKKKPATETVAGESSPGDSVVVADGAFLQDQKAEKPLIEL